MFGCIQTGKDQTSLCNCGVRSRYGLLIYSKMSNDPVSGQRMPRSVCADAQVDLGIHYSHILTHFYKLRLIISQSQQFNFFPHKSYKCLNCSNNWPTIRTY